MGESSSWLGALVLAGVITGEQADWVWSKIITREIPPNPSSVVRQVKPLIAQAKVLFPDS